MLPALLRYVQTFGHRVFAAMDFDVNLVLQRSRERKAGRMDDLLSLVYLDGGRWVERAFPCSGDPGRKALAEHKDMTLGDLLEGIVLHAFDGKQPFSPETLATIAQLKAIYGLDLDAEASHRLQDRKGE